jgi:hypothetical protein
VVSRFLNLISSFTLPTMLLANFKGGVYEVSP